LDDPHHGVDLAEENDDHVALAGHGVQAALAGTVAMVTNDRFPYGNAVLIETPLEQIVSLESAGLPVPTLAPTLAPRSALTCPAFTNPPAWDASARSVYLLYAHLQAPVDLQVGDVVTCGQPLGAVGDSGNALNPHLHLEARFGPTGARDDGDPILGRTLAGSHSGFGRLLGDWFIGEYLYPDLAAALYIARHGYTGCLYLVGLDPCRLKRHQAVLAVGDSVAAGCFALHAAALNTTVLNALWH
jgi:hypothetical protein